MSQVDIDRMRAAVRKDLERANRPQPTLAVEEALAELREAGWAVAVHNDYKLAGKSHTFWLFTRGDSCVRGEGETDEAALMQVRTILASRQPSKAEAACAALREALAQFPTPWRMDSTCIRAADGRYIASGDPYGGPWTQGPLLVEAINAFAAAREDDR